MNYRLCSDCFKDYGLRKMAERLGIKDKSTCSVCGSNRGRKLDNGTLSRVCDEYFVSGSYTFPGFGASPVLMVDERGEYQDVNNDLMAEDLQLIKSILGISFAYYAPPMWRVGITEWLERLRSRNIRVRNKAIMEAIARCGTRVLGPGSLVFRVRLNPDNPTEVQSYDAPPIQHNSSGRFNTSDDVSLYASFDVETCLFECRASKMDRIYVAALSPNLELRLLDFTKVSSVKEEEPMFGELPLAIRQIFAAGNISYRLTQRFAKAIKQLGYDGIVYPSFFDDIKSGNTHNLLIF